MTLLKFIWLVWSGQFDQHLEGLVRRELSQERIAEQSRIRAAVVDCSKVRFLRRTRMQ